MPDHPTPAPEPGAVLVRFEDDSGIVFGDGSPEEADALRTFLREQGAMRKWSRDSRACFWITD